MKKLILPAIALLMAAAACNKEPKLSIPDKNFSIGESAEGQAIGLQRDSTVSIIFPSTFKQEQYTNMELLMESGDTDSWSISVYAPSFNASGEYLGKARVAVHPGSSTVMSSVVLRAKVFWADGTTTEATRTFFKDETFENTLGLYRVGKENEDYLYISSLHQIAFRKYASAVTFALSDVSADTYFLCTGLPTGLTEGKETSFTLMQNWTEDLPAKSTVEATVLKVADGLIWLRDADKVKYVFKY